MPVFHKEDGRWHGVVCANCGWELYSSLPRLSSTVSWWHIGETKCARAEPSPEDVRVMKARSTHGYHLTEQDGKAVQEVLNRYLSQLRSEVEMYTSATGEVDYQGVKDIDYITGLAKLFD